ncbi:MAG TPA: DUF3034 family protein [Steroidobacteraceae bacterium]|nr:DUF3034 family protein [Steroidobacteraceae bacterium]
MRSNTIFGCGSPNLACRENLHPSRERRAVGGGLVPWALVGEFRTDAEVGATAFVTQVSAQDFVGY